MPRHPQGAHVAVQCWVQLSTSNMWKMTQIFTTLWQLEVTAYVNFWEVCFRVTLATSINPDAKITTFFKLHMEKNNTNPFQCLATLFTRGKETPRASAPLSSVTSICKMRLATFAVQWSYPASALHPDTYSYSYAYSLSPSPSPFLLCPPLLSSGFSPMSTPTANFLQEENDRLLLWHTQLSPTQTPGGRKGQSQGVGGFGS